MTDFSSFSDEEWLQLLLRSLRSRVVDGIQFPGFPDEKLQSQFVGSSNESALLEGFNFYKLTRGYVNNAPIKDDEGQLRFLDFGCGWGRYLRLFRKDFSPRNMYGVDVDPSVLEVCKECGVPGQFEVIEPKGKLPFPDQYFDLIVAYSVFTHLPEYIHQHWIRELSRVARPGCLFVLTLEPLRFLDFVAGLNQSEPATDWHKNLSRFSSSAMDLKKDFAAGRFVYIPTGGGDYRPADVYGEAIVPPKYLEENWAGKFEILEYVDDPDRFWQAVVVARKPLT